MFDTVLAIRTSEKAMTEAYSWPG